jgi:ABC-type branched-subunit amino acid transport system ATPase component
MSGATIEVNGRKRFGLTLALAGVSFTVRPGQVSGFAGPNVVSNSHLARHIQHSGPATAGLAIQDTIGLRNLPISPWAGLGVLAAWASGALLTGGVVLRLRDA